MTSLCHFLPILVHFQIIPPFLIPSFRVSKHLASCTPKMNVLSQLLYLFFHNRNNRTKHFDALICSYTPKEMGYNRLFCFATCQPRIRQPNSGKPCLILVSAGTCSWLGQTLGYKALIRGSSCWVTRSVWRWWFYFNGI